ncbi:Universal stress protein [Enhygromyxa salina]|uniref:Universal stress protein n=1 Tax=Enhygromyxa salina TaxID=215803 RepID=A0A2S9YJT0_9BACT|nr:universal stress protein [Enhygromyxa salina]PRQ05330.1 Universal stress protein [Enhygromyxa salina]
MSDTNPIDDPVAAWTLPKRKVVVPFDFSEASRKALEVARTFVPDAGMPDGGTISVIHIIVPPPMTAPGRLLRGPFDEERAIAQGFTVLREALADAGVPEFEAHVRVASNPAEELVAFAERDRSELIVISSHARRGFDRWLLGSTAERVVRLAPCPVLVLRGPKPQ